MFNRLPRRPVAVLPDCNHITPTCPHSISMSFPYELAHAWTPVSRRFVSLLFGLCIVTPADDFLEKRFTGSLQSSSHQSTIPHAHTSGPHAQVNPRAPASTSLCTGLRGYTTTHTLGQPCIRTRAQPPIHACQRSRASQLCLLQPSPLCTPSTPCMPVQRQRARTPTQLPHAHARMLPDAFCSRSLSVPV